MTRNELKQIVEQSNLDELGADIRLHEAIKELVIYVGRLIATNHNETDLLIAHNDVIKATNDILILKAIKLDKGLYRG